MVGGSKLGDMRASGPLAAGLVLLGVAACQLVAGVESRALDPLRGGCALPSGAGPQVRVANLVPAARAIDVCLRAAGGSYGEPVVLDGGTACTSASYFGKAGGFAYGQVSVAFTAPAARVDVRMVAAGSSCSAAPLAEASNVSLSASAATTLALVGGGATTLRLAALPENRSVTQDSTDVRFVHAIPGLGPLDFGQAPAGVSHLPTVLSAAFLTQPVAFGAVPPAGEPALVQNIKPDGYFTLPSGSFDIVAAAHGASPEKALLLQPLTVASGATFSLYATGLPGSNQFPVRGLLCAEGSAPHAASGNPLLSACQGSTLPTISVDVFNTGLYGPNSPDFSLREGFVTGASTSPIPAQAAASNTDILCLAEMDYYNDQTALAAIVGSPDAGGGTGQLPYAYIARTSVDTPFSNPADQRPPPQAPPCAGTVDQGVVNTAMQCMVKNCSTRPGDPSGTLVQSTDCLTTNCLVELGGLQAQFPYCFDCLLGAHVAGNDPYSTSLTACETVDQAPLAFGGQSPVMILSRHPLLDTDTFILPSSIYRQTIAYAKVQLEDQTVDFYCGFFNSTLVATDLPYTGDYGMDGSPKSAQAGGGYANEQLLEAQRLTQWVQSKSGSSPAIVVGDWRSGVGGPNDAGPPSPLVPATVMTLFNAPGFVGVSAPGWTPQCNFCPGSQNPLNGSGTDSYFVSQPFLYNWPQASSALVDEQLTFTTPIIDTGSGGTVPPSPYYGLNFHVIRPQ